MITKCQFIRRILVPIFVGILLISSPLYAQSTTNIMPLGDSITGSPGCWRAFLWEKLQNAGLTDKLNMVGTLAPQGCAVPHDGDNEGHGGILATNMASQNQLPAWLSATNPKIVLMHLGTNDVWSNRSTDSILGAFTTLVNQMRANNPTMKILVAKIIPMDAAGSCAGCPNGVIALNNGLTSWAAGLTTSASPIVLVDQWTGFSATADTYDGVHPNTQGDKKMADKWYPALVAALGNVPTSSSAASSVKSSAALSSVRSSIAVTSGQQCNWYGTSYPLCVSTQSGWGWENSKSCIARVTCSGQPAPYGIVGEVVASSSVAPSSVSVVSSSSAANRAPIAKITASTYMPTGCTTSGRASAAGSTDPDGDSLTYEWAISTGTSSYASVATGIDITFGMTQIVTYNIKLTVSDGRGGVSEATAQLSHSNTDFCSGTSSSGGSVSSSAPSSVPIISSSNVRSSSSVAAVSGACSYVVTNQWNGGFTGAIRIKNNGVSVLNGWNLSWNYSDGSKITNSWNANLSGANPYVAANLSWNSSIQPGQTVEFGFQGTKGSAAAQVPQIAGTVCQ